MNASLTPNETTVQTAKLLIDGQWVESQTSEWHDIVNPATQQVLAKVPFATAEEVNAAIDAAQRAFQTWKLTPIGARMRIMLKLQALIREHSKRIAVVLSNEQGKTIADVLQMTISEGCVFFEHQPKIHRMLLTLEEVGLGYVQLGQSSTTLSGGEAQRIKLAAELAKRATGKTIYILDEPSTGLHFEDIQLLLKVLQRLVDEGNTVLVIEHNLDMIKTADYIIDIGPEGGQRGGQVLFEGTPQQMVKKAQKVSYTAKYLAQELKKR